ncbi:hypothetical protein B5V88_02265 [Heyndrickxia sporothermodurans]|nr:hypothetical protein B5V88_02265 [Heyndrickxia sporothermodurans]PTY84433.1 hypothetical protein B5V91_13660 [Heyndrickxia sporothermodurans]PTY89571.1 hypothetical protein B5V90_07685 [Heyndrickxia sporothermodurans]
MIMRSVASLRKQIDGIIEQTLGIVSIVVEINEETIISKNSKREMSSASLIKIPIIMAAFQQAELGKIDLEEKIEVKPEHKVGGSGVIQYLTEGTLLSVKDLLTLMIIVSDNTATNMMIDLVGQETINYFNKQIGCNHTRLERRLMDYVARDMGLDNVTSASDMVIFLKEIVENQFLTSKSTYEILNILSGQQFQDKLPAMMDSDHVFVANKTGEIPGVEHDVAIIRHNDDQVFMAVLIDQLENQYEGKQIIARTGKAVYDYLIQ